MIPEAKWKWYGTAGHFICGHWCRFHLCTQVGKYLISTVGAYIPPEIPRINETAWLKENWPGADIGAGRKYETMVFRAGPPCKAEKCNCGQPAISGSNLDFAEYNTARAATSGHIGLCRKWASARKGGRDASKRG